MKTRMTQKCIWFCLKHIWWRHIFVITIDYCVLIISSKALFKSYQFSIFFEFYALGEKFWRLPQTNNKQFLMMIQDQPCNLNLSEGVRRRKPQRTSERTFPWLGIIRMSNKKLASELLRWERGWLFNPRREPHFCIPKLQQKRVENLHLQLKNEWEVSSAHYVFTESI